MSTEWLPRCPHAASQSRQAMARMGPAISTRTFGDPHTGQLNIELSFDAGRARRHPEGCVRDRAKSNAVPEKSGHLSVS